MDCTQPAPCSRRHTVQLTAGKFSTQDKKAALAGLQSMKDNGGMGGRHTDESSPPTWTGDDPQPTLSRFGDQVPSRKRGAQQRFVKECALEEGYSDAMQAGIPSKREEHDRMDQAMHSRDNCAIRLVSSRRRAETGEAQRDLITPTPQPDDTSGVNHVCQQDRNPERDLNGPQIEKIRDIVQNGANIDMAPDFKPIHRTAAYRNL
eukprot:gene61775-biopygen27207